jgi:hypothetical protein
VIVQSSSRKGVQGREGRAGGYGWRIGEGFDGEDSEILVYDSAAARSNRDGGLCGGNDTVTLWGPDSDSGSQQNIYFFLICIYFIQASRSKSFPSPHLNSALFSVH